MDWITDPEIWISLITLTVLEIVLGIDNIVFISILSGKLPEEEQIKARRIGLGLALGTRILLLMSLATIIQLTSPIIDIFGQDLSWRDIILVVGGLFLLGKSTVEIHDNLEGKEVSGSSKPKVSFKSIIIQILILDLVFSLDSVITAVGMANSIGVMITAVIIAVIIMLFTVESISSFVDAHPTVKILALSFLLLIGFSLVAEGFGQEISKGYIYFAMSFSVFVEMLNLKLAKGGVKPVKLHSEIK